MKLEDLLKPNNTNRTGEFTLNSPVEDYDSPFREGDVGLSNDNLPTNNNLDYIFNDPKFEGSVLQQSIQDVNDIITNNLDNQINDEILDQFKSRESILSNIMSHDEVSGLYDTNTIYPDYLVIDPEVVGYPNDDFQEIIYNWVGSKIPYGNVSVKDIGCGRGDFGNWLITNRPDAEYVGIDYNPTIINVGKQKYNNTLKLITNEYSKEDIRTDYTVCIGTLNEDNGLDKWANFNKTLIYALNNTNHTIFFVLARNFDLYDGYCDFPFNELFNHLDKNIMFEIDYSKLEDIYLLTINIGSFNT